MTVQQQIPEGLRTEEARQLQEQFGKNELVTQKKETFFRKALHIVCEPMFLLLLVAAVIYFLLGEPRDGAIMLVFVLGIIGIDVFQEWKTDRTLDALRDLSAPHVTVLRDGREQQILSAELVPGDLMLLCEGVKVPADGSVLQCSDFCVDESSLTGEAEGVWKQACASGAREEGSHWRRDYCYAGTMILQGTATVRVEQTGPRTEFGKIGAHIAQAPETPTPLQKQTGGLVKLCAGIAAVLFALVGLFTYLELPDHAFGDRIIESILSGVTLAMAMIPEEFPVILTVFLSMGAWRLAKKQSLVRKLPAVETLGAVSVLCVDKTGTITKNQMEVRDIWAPDKEERLLCETMGLGCEPQAYDPMEKAMLAFCEGKGFPFESLFSGELVTEYAFTNEQKMMGHVWSRGDGLVVAAKGSPERILAICELESAGRDQAVRKAAEMAGMGLRVIAVGRMEPATHDAIPAALADCRLTFLGLIGLADPPREEVARDIAVCTRAGIRVVMITGDNGVTAAAIARQIGMPAADQIVTGEQLDAMTDEELRRRVLEASIFSRVVPAHKMRIVKALRDNGEIVAMTGDGVNDAPALKYADIGIAMGKRGSEVAREAADLILMDDNFSTIVDTVRDGRRIYDNIRKAVGYVFSIHIPIAFASLLCPLLGIGGTGAFLLPLHIVLLELLIDPTCSIVLERQPAEENLMERRPRPRDEKLLTARTLFKSVLQGLVIFAASFGAYYTVLPQSGAAVARSMGLGVLMLSNLLLVFVNSSSWASIVHSMQRLARDKVMWAVACATIAGLLLILYTPLNGFLKLAPLSALQLAATAGLAGAAVLWYEAVKLVLRVRKRRAEK